MVNIFKPGEGIQPLRENIEQSTEEELDALRDAIELWPNSARRALALAILEHLRPTLH